MWLSRAQQSDAAPMRTPRDSTYARVAAGGDYDADWEEHYAPPPPPLNVAAQAPEAHAAALTAAATPRGTTRRQSPHRGRFRAVVVGGRDAA